MRLRHVLSSVLGVLTVALLAACGGDDPGADDVDAAPLAQGEAGQVRVDPDEVGHIHGLGVDPADGVLMVASHNGLFRLGAESLDRVGEGTLDLMGFAVAGPGRYLASGHPGPAEEGPPLLGLIETTDSGQQWEEVSLSGEADFHAMAVDGPQIYGYESYGGELMVSDDGGRTWTGHQPPGPILSLAIDPRDPDRVVASTTEALAVSGDAGATWSPVAGEPGLLAWSEPDGLFHVNVAGQARISADGGSSWQPAGSIGGMPAALFARDSDELYAARDDLTILHSTDAGETWSEIASPAA